MAGSRLNAAGEERALSLGASFAATFAGNAIFAACQWGATVMVARLGNAELLGEYALAIAIATPVTLFSHLNLRAALATDMMGRHPFGDYAAVRLATAGAGQAAVLAIAFAGGYSHSAALVVAFAGLVLSADNVSDIYYGAMQRRDRMDQVARSTAARGALSTAALGVTLWATHSLALAVAAQAAGRLAVLLAYDLPVGSRGELRAATGIRNQARILTSALPLGMALMLAALAVNIPRYAIESRLGMAFSAHSPRRPHSSRSDPRWSMRSGRRPRRAWPAHSAKATRAPSEAWP